MGEEPVPGGEGVMVRERPWHEAFLAGAEICEARGPIVQRAASEVVRDGEDLSRKTVRLDGGTELTGGMIALDEVEGKGHLRGLWVGALRKEGIDGTRTGTIAGKAFVNVGS